MTIQDALSSARDQTEEFFINKSGDKAMIRLYVSLLLVIFALASTAVPEQDSFGPLSEVLAARGYACPSEKLIEMLHLDTNLGVKTIESEMPGYSWQHGSCRLTLVNGNALRYDTGTKQLVSYIDFRTPQSKEDAPQLSTEKSEIIIETLLDALEIPSKTDFLKKYVKYPTKMQVLLIRKYNGAERIEGEIALNKEGHVMTMFFSSLASPVEYRPKISKTQAIAIVQEKLRLLGEEMLNAQVNEIQLGEPIGKDRRSDPYKRLFHDRYFWIVSFEQNTWVHFSCIPELKTIQCRAMVDIETGESNIREPS